jgi:hypothetical protein
MRKWLKSLCTRNVESSVIPQMNLEAKLNKVSCKESFYVSTPIDRGGDNPPTSTQNRFNGIRVKRLKPFKKGVEVDSFNPWMNPGVNLKTPISSPNPIYVSTRIGRVE